MPLTQSYYRMGIPNPDFPGIARFFRQLAVPEALHIHFTGAGGNIGAGKYNDGSKENRLILAERLADGMKRAWEATELQAVSNNSVDWKVKKVMLPADTTKVNSYLFRYQAGTTIDIQCMALNNTRVLFMPGELFVEYQLAAKQMRPDLQDVYKRQVLVTAALYSSQKGTFVAVSYTHLDVYKRQAHWSSSALATYAFRGAINAISWCWSTGSDGSRLLYFLKLPQNQCGNALLIISMVSPNSLLKLSLIHI